MQPISYNGAYNAASSNPVSVMGDESELALTIDPVSPEVSLHQLRSVVAELFTALKDQLYDDYMIRLRSPVGIYLVGWFDKAKWDSKDDRRRRTPDCTLQEVQERLDAQAAAIPAGFLVRSIVIDCHAP